MMTEHRPEDPSDRKDAGGGSAPVPTALRVLVVEDDPAVADITCRMVRQAGYSCEWVRRGKEAIAMVEGGSFPADLFIIEIVLPDISGIDVARQVTEYRPAAPVLFVSAYPEYRVEPPLFERGRFLPKPHSGAELTQALHELLPLIRTAVHSS